MEDLVSDDIGPGLIGFLGAECDRDGIPRGYVDRRDECDRAVSHAAEELLGDRPEAGRRRDTAGQQPVGDREASGLVVDCGLSTSNRGPHPVEIAPDGKRGPMLFLFDTWVDWGVRRTIPLRGDRSRMGDACHWSARLELQKRRRLTC